MVRRAMKKYVKEKYYEEIHDGIDFSYEDTPEGITTAFTRDFAAAGVDFKILDASYDNGNTKVKWEIIIYTGDLYDILDNSRIPDTYSEEYRLERAAYSFINTAFDNYKVDIDKLEFKGNLNSKKSVFIVDGIYKQDLS